MQDRDREKRKREIRRERDRYIDEYTRKDRDRGREKDADTLEDMDHWLVILWFLLVFL